MCSSEEKEKEKESKEPSEELQNFSKFINKLVGWLFLLSNTAIAIYTGLVFLGSQVRVGNWVLLDRQPRT